MSDASLTDRVDRGIEALLAGDGSEVAISDPEIAGLLVIAAELRCLPEPDFKARLRIELLESGIRASTGRVLAAGETDNTEEEETVVIAPARNTGKDPASQILPSLFGSGYNAYPVQRSSFMASLAAHAAALALIVTSAIWAAQGMHEHPRVHSLLVTDITYVLPPAATQTHGGGGGGDHDILQASKGNPPRFAPQQIAPPAIVVRTEQPKLPTQPTVVGPPNLSFPQTSQLGDPLSGILGPPSNGIGSRGGIGSGDGGGVGLGTGPGVGLGWGGGMGGGPYVPGGGVSAPRAVYDPEPEYSEEARKAKYQGIAILQVVIDSEGRPRDVRVARSAGMGLDEKAIEAVRQWRFEPGRLNGKAVAVVVNVEVNFRLY